MKTVIIDNTEYELEVHDKGKKFDEIEIPKGYRLLKPWEAQRLFDLGHLKLAWFFVENTNNELKEEGYVARFVVYSDSTRLYCDEVRSLSYADLGVIFARDLKMAISP